MPKLKKINLDQIKDFLFNHGEKVALGTCAFLALILGGWGMLNAFSASRDDKGVPWMDEFDKKYKELVMKMGGAQPPTLSPEELKKLEMGEYDWTEHGPFLPQLPPPWPPNVEVDITKRDNPNALTILQNKGDKRYVQIDYVRSLVHSYQYVTAPKVAVNVFDADGGIVKGNINAGNQQYYYVRDAKPRRMLVVTAIFPMKEQVEEYVRKLRMTKQKELADSRDDWPKPNGLNIYRFEVVNGKEGPAEKLVLYSLKDGKVKPDLSKGLDDFLRFSMFDENVAEKLEPYAFEGLLMPAPKLAFGNYEDVDLENIKISFKTEDPEKTPKKGAANDPNKGGPGIVIGKGKKVPLPPMPMPKGKEKPEAAPEGKPVGKVFAEVEKSDSPLAHRVFKDEYNAYHILGLNAPDPQKAGPNIGLPNMNQPNLLKYFTAFTLPPWGQPVGGQAPPNLPPMPKPGVQPGADVPNWDRDALVRFVDPDVQPGKMYRYAIQVRFKNPNFDKKDLVAFFALSENEELPKDPTSNFVKTQDIKIPPEYFLYAMDQQMLDAQAGVEGVKPPVYDAKKDRDATPFQVQKWVGKGTNSDASEDYMIGDWVIAERLMVRKGSVIGANAEVKIAAWKMFKDAFVVPHNIKGKPDVPGTHMTLLPGSSRTEPMLIDFAGGKRRTGNVEEESAVEALVMDTSGKLIVLNSRTDSEAGGRKDRLITSRKRIAELDTLDTK